MTAIWCDECSATGWRLISEAEAASIRSAPGPREALAWTAQDGYFRPCRCANGRKVAVMIGQEERP